MLVGNVIKILLGLIVAVIIFHLAILCKWIPYDIAWGGKLTNDSQMYAFETISIAINLFLAWILLMKGQFSKQMISTRAINRALWCFLVIFLLNTVGNLFAEANFEKWFSVLTLIFSVLIWIVLKAKPALK